jgi:hypothetical protein
MNLASLVPAGTSVPSHINSQYMHNQPRTNKGSGQPDTRLTQPGKKRKCVTRFFNSRQQRLKKGCVQFSRWRGEATRSGRWGRFWSEVDGPEQPRPSWLCTGWSSDTQKIERGKTSVCEMWCCFCLEVASCGSDRGEYVATIRSRARVKGAGVMWGEGFPSVRTERKAKIRREGEG